MLYISCIACHEEISQKSKAVWGDFCAAQVSFSAQAEVLSAKKKIPASPSPPIKKRKREVPSIPCTSITHPDIFPKKKFKKKHKPVRTGKYLTRWWS